MRLVMVALIITLLIAGCGRATPVILRATPITAVTPTRTVASTATNIPTLKPSPTQTAAPSPIPTIAQSSIVGKHSLTPIAELRGFTGTWSPTANQLAGILWDETGKGHLTVVSAPDFLPTSLLPEFVYTETNFGHEVSWKPDGSWILLGGPAGLDEIGEASSLWAVKPSGEGARRFLKNTSPLIWMKIPGWLDADTLILESHLGGDTWLTRLVDFESGRTLAQANIPGEVFPGRPSGAPFEYHVSKARVGVLTTIQQGQGQGRDISYIRMMPEYDRMLPAQNRTMDVLGWQPGTDKLLVSVETLAMDSYASSLEAAQVVAWDMTTDDVVQIAPRTGYAEYSPDGQWLALMAYNDLPINPDLTIDQSATPDVWEGLMGPQLYLVDKTDGKVKLHVPVGFSYRCCNDFFPSRIPWAAFSLDGRYLAFITYGAAQINQAVLPEKKPPIPELNFELNVLDLETLQLTLNGFPVSSRFEPTFLWSASGEDLFYDTGYAFGGSGPGVLNVISGEWSDINIDPNLNVEPVAWSQDGMFLSLQASLPPAFMASDTHTLIFKVK